MKQVWFHQQTNVSLCLSADYNGISWNKIFWETSSSKIQVRFANPKKLQCPTYFLENVYFSYLFLQTRQHYSRSNSYPLGPSGCKLHFGSKAQLRVQPVVPWIYSGKPSSMWGNFPEKTSWFYSQAPSLSFWPLWNGIWFHSACKWINIAINHNKDNHFRLWPVPHQNGWSQLWTAIWRWDKQTQHLEMSCFFTCFDRSKSQFNLVCQNFENHLNKGWLVIISVQLVEVRSCRSCPRGRSSEVIFLGSVKLSSVFSRNCLFLSVLCFYCLWVWSLLTIWFCFFLSQEPWSQFKAPILKVMDHIKSGLVKANVQS